MSNSIESYRIKKINQLQRNVDRSLRLIQTIEGIGQMTGGDVKQLDDMMKNIQSSLTAVSSGKQPDTNKQLISNAQVDEIKQWVSKSKEVMSEALKLAQKEKSAGSSVTYPEFKASELNLGLPDTLLSSVTDSATSESAVPSQFKGATKEGASKAPTDAKAKASPPSSTASKTDTKAKASPTVSKTSPTGASKTSPPGASKTATKSPASDKSSSTAKSPAKKDDKAEELTKATNMVKSTSKLNTKIKTLDGLIKDPKKAKDKAKNTALAAAMKAHLAYAQAVVTAKGDTKATAVVAAKKAWDTAEAASMKAGNKKSTEVKEKYQRWGWWDRH